MDIDIGNEAVWESNNASADWQTTCINKSNPATVTGHITKIEIYPMMDIPILDVASFQKVGTNTFTVRDSQNLGAVNSGTEITAVEINNGGNGYLVDDILEINQTSGVPKAEVKVLTIGGGGAITSIELVSAGNYHYIANGVATSEGTGANATVNITVVTGKQTIVTDIDVVIGDYIGFSMVDGLTGSVVLTLTGGNGMWGRWGDKIPCTNQAFDSYSNYKLMIGGEITPSIAGSTGISGSTGATTSTGSFQPIEISGSVAVYDQPDIQKTYYNIDGSLVVDGGVDYKGLGIDGDINVVRNIVEACTSTVQGIRFVVTINGSDVTNALVGQIYISHNLNYISSFFLQLKGAGYSPLVNTDIAIDSEVVISAYINLQYMKVFTGLIDEVQTNNSSSNFEVNIRGRDYGKKLLNKTMTLISIQDTANNPTRGLMVEYLAEQAGITNVDIPTGDGVTIDHSFQDQTIWDMIQKECAIEGWYVRFNENNIMLVEKRNIKTFGDWEYGEDGFVELGLLTTDEGIINKVIILGYITEITTIVQDIETSTGTGTIPIEGSGEIYEYTNYTFTGSFAAGGIVTGWTDGDAVIRVTATYAGYSKPSGYIFPVSQNYSFTISGSDSGKIRAISFTVSGGATKGGQGSHGVTVLRGIGSYMGGSTGVMPSFMENAFSVTITFKVKNQTGGGIEELEESNPEETFTEVMTYEQVKATVTDDTSIATYGERKPNNEGTLNFPLAETEEQCKRIGENVILDSHRFIKQPDFEVSFNPKLTVGQMVELTDMKIGYDGDLYLVEEVVHSIDVSSDGKMKARTRIGCVYYV